MNSTYKIETRHEGQTDLSRQNLWGVVAFLLISMSAYSCRDFNLVSSVPVSLKQIFGCPPPAFLISMALAVYCFSATTFTLTAMARDMRPERRWHHLGYRGAFYFFYSFSGSIAENFLPVLFVGICLYALDQFHIRFYHSRITAEERHC